jgi:hypothetical protein
VSTYKPNHRSFGEFMLSQQIRKPVREIAELIKTDAVAGTPVRTGELAGSYEVNDVTPVVAGGNPRAAYEVRNSDPAAVPQEFGNKHVRGHRMLGKAASKFGDQRGEGVTD